jgi:hypothetical protein
MIINTLSNHRSSSNTTSPPAPNPRVTFPTPSSSLHPQFLPRLRPHPH